MYEKLDLCMGAPLCQGLPLELLEDRHVAIDSQTVELLQAIVVAVRLLRRPLKQFAYARAESMAVRTCAR